jgi:subtilisin
MRRRLVVGFAFSLILTALVSASRVGATPTSGAAATGRYIVVLKDSVGSPQAVAAEHARTHQAQIKHVYETALLGYSARLSATRVAALWADPRVAYVAADRPIRKTAQILPTGIDRIDGEKSSTGSGDGRGRVDVDVAVLDTGIDLDHPDLNVVGGRDCVNNSNFDDPDGHGTHVAGIVAARDNRFGVVGVAPGARLWAVKVLGPQGGTVADVICGVNWVTRHRDIIEVANMSLSGPGAEPPGLGCTTGDPEHDAICRSVRAGVTYVVGAGNDASNARNSTPAAYDEVITVSALTDFDGKPGGRAGRQDDCAGDTDVDDTFWNFSNFGADIDLIAPGVCIRSTVPGGYDTFSGTSMASPHVAGAAALYKASHPNASPLAVKRALRRTGNLNWRAGDDPDGIKEKLVNVDTF